MILAIALASAGDPVLGPTGWVRLGPLPNANDRESVTFDLRTCAIEVERVDLDGGPANHDVRLARVWDRGWRWADDWRVEGSTLLRPGRDPAPLSGPREFQGIQLETDAGGWVTARTSRGRRVEVLREGGAFVGMRAGPIRVRLEDEREGRSEDDRIVKYARAGPILTGVTGPRTTSYLYEGGVLSGIRWADGASLALATRTADDGSTVSTTRGLGGDWTCSASTTRSALRGPGGSWLLTRSGGVESLTDPTGSTTRSSWVVGRLTTWTDPRGGTTRIGRDGFGRVTTIDPPDGASWTASWSEGALVNLTGPDGGGWRLTNDARGLPTDLVDPSGRTAGWDWEGGHLRAARVGTGRRSVSTDSAGRVLSITDPAGSRTDIGRDNAGRATSVRDGGGGRWALVRDASGDVSRVIDPGGQTWDLTRDTLGRVVAAGPVKWTLSPEGQPGRVTISGGAWDLTWASALSQLRDPLGQTTNFARDALGRLTEVRRADDERWPIRRDGNGEVSGVGSLEVRRDLLGRPVSLAASGRSVSWDRDSAGNVVGVSAPGLTLTIQRDRSGLIAGVSAGGESVALERDAQGRVVRATAGSRSTSLIRDAAGRVIRVDDAAGTLKIDRDVRGLEARFLSGTTTWSLGRDAAGRVVLVDAPGARLGVDRGVDGSPSLIRLSTGTLAQLTRTGRDVVARIADRDGRAVAEVGWGRDDVGRLVRLTAARPILGALQAALRWSLRRDPLGVLVAAEAGDDAWSLAPDHLDLPGGREVSIVDGLPSVASDTDGWGLGRGRHTLEARAGSVVAVTGPRGAVALARDAFGRLSGWRGPSGENTIIRDAFGRITAVGPSSLLGWGAPLRTGPVVAAVDGVAYATADGGALISPLGPVFQEGAGAPISGDGWYTPPTGPALSLTGARDPTSGLSLDDRWTSPWEPLDAEPSPGKSPWSDPDDASTPAWDPDGWEPTSPLSDPLRLLVACGDLPDGGPRSVRSPGLPWLPASLVPSIPTPLPDPAALPLDEDPIVLWILGHAMAPTTAAEPWELAAELLKPRMGDALVGPPALLRGLPEVLAP